MAASCGQALYSEDDVFPETGPVISAIARSIVRWQDISIDFSITGAEEQAILQENQHSASSQKIAFLRKWRSKNGSRATFKELASLFRQAGCTALSEEVLGYCKGRSGVSGDGGGGGGEASREAEKSDSKNLIKKSDKPTLPILTAFPTRDGGFIDVAQRIGANYRRFGIQLMNDTDGSVMSKLEKKHHSDSDEILDVIFSEWIQGKGSACTWGRLLECLRRCRCHALADELEKNFA